MMNNSLSKDSLQQAQEILNHTPEGTNSIDVWMWIAILEFFVILFLILNLFLSNKQSKKQNLKEEALNEEVDFYNIIDSSFNSTEIYDELKVKCHPDRFPNDKEKRIIADKLFQEITENKTNISRLKELKEEAKEKLNLNF